MHAHKASYDATKYRPRVCYRTLRTNSICEGEAWHRLGNLLMRGHPGSLLSSPRHQKTIHSATYHTCTRIHSGSSMWEKREREGTRAWGWRRKPLEGKSVSLFAQAGGKILERDHVNSFRGNKHGRLTPAISDLLASVDDDSDDLEKRCRKINARCAQESVFGEAVSPWRDREHG